MASYSIVNIDTDLVVRIRKEVYSKKADGEKISIKQWICEACEDKFKKNKEKQTDQR